jgi:hypothetical protein
VALRLPKLFNLRPTRSSTPAQRAASFTIDQAVEKLETALPSGR